MVKWMQEKVERCVAREGTLRGRGGRNSTGGNGTEERGRRGEMKGLGKAQTWKRRAEPHRRNTKPDASSGQTKLFICCSFSSSSPNVDILQLSCPGSTALCFLSVFDKGDHGGWSSVDLGASRSLMEECFCLLLHTPSQLKTHLWAFLRSLPARSKEPPPPLWSISTFPCSIPETHTHPALSRGKIKLALHSLEWIA